MNLVESRDAIERQLRHALPPKSSTRGFHGFLWVPLDPRGELLLTANARSDAHIISTGLPALAARESVLAELTFDTNRPTMSAVAETSNAEREAPRRTFPPLYVSAGDASADRLAFFHILERLKVNI